MKVLLAVDASPVSRKAVEFVGQIFGARQNKDLSIVVLHIVESLPEYLVQKSAATGAFQQVAAEWAASNLAAAQTLLSETQTALQSAGVVGSVITSKIISRESRPESSRVVATLAIIDEMKSGGYDLVVLGRRGNSANVESLIGSVAEKVARAANGVSVCIVD